MFRKGQAVQFLPADFKPSLGKRFKHSRNDSHGCGPTIHGERGVERQYVLSFELRFVKTAQANKGHRKQDVRYAKLRTGLHRPPCTVLRLLEVSSLVFGNCDGQIRVEGIDWAEPEGAPRPLYGGFPLSHPCKYKGAVAERNHV